MKLGLPRIAVVLGLALTVGGSGVAAAAPGGTCNRLPAGKRIVKLNLKPDTNVADLVAWISAITCRTFVMPIDGPAGQAKVTIYAPNPITPEEAYRLFLDALESVGLTVLPSGGFFRIVETAKAKTLPIPVIGLDGRRTSA
jgi:general secretion pathway protein D